MTGLSLFGKETINPSRLIAFSDGIFAIAVTLLAFNLKIPDIDPAKVHVLLPAQIKAMAPHFFTYVVSFLLVAVYWTIHHRMLDRIAHVDSTFVWLNIAYLLVISFMPFPAGLMGTYPHERVCEVFYLGSATTVSALSMTMWAYASHNHRLLHKTISKEQVRYFFTRATVSLSVIVLALVLALLNVHGTQYAILLLIPSNYTVKRFYEAPGKRYSTKERAHRVVES